MTEFTAWRSLVDGEEIVGTPDTVVDDFEWGGPVSDRYSGETASYDINTDSPVLEGDFSLKGSGESDNIYSNENDGLDYYPEVGDEVWFWANPIENDCGPAVLIFGTGGNPDFFDNGLAVELNDRDDEFSIFIDGNEEHNPSQSYSLNQWYLVRIHTAEDDGDLQYQVILHDGPEEQDEVLQDISGTASSSDTINNRTVAFLSRRADSDYAIDRVVSNPGAGSPDV